MREAFALSDDLGWDRAENWGPNPAKTLRWVIALSAIVTGSIMIVVGISSPGTVTSIISRPLKELVRIAKIRWRIEHDYRELKTGLGLAHFEGRTWAGWWPCPR